MTILPSIFVTIAVLAPFALLTTAAIRARRTATLRWHADQFRVTAPMVGRLFADDADLRRVEHDVDAIRTRFEQHPTWPRSGAVGERR